MKKIVLILVFAMFTSISGVAQEIKWVSLEEAVELQKKNPKKIIMDAYTNWCGPCKLLDKKTFKNKDVVAYVNKHFYAVKFNAEGNEEISFKENTFKNPSYDPAKANKRNSVHELARYFSVRSYPSVIFIDEKGSLLTSVVGYKTPQQFELYLKLFKNNEHINMTSQDKFNEYFNSFKPEFTN